MKFLILWILSLDSVAFACNCAIPTNQQAFCAADIVARVKIIGKVLTADFSTIHYTVKYVDYWKSPSWAPLSFEFQSSAISVSCGVSNMEVGKDYLVTANIGQDYTQRIYRCGQFKDGGAWSLISEYLKKQLMAGFNCQLTPTP